MNSCFILDGREIPLRIKLSHRKTSVIMICPDLSLEFRGDVSKSIESIYALLEKKTAVIRKKLAFFEQFHPQPTERQYINGETFHYLGRQYRLKLVQSDYSKVRLIGKWFLVDIPDTGDIARIRKLMDKWFRDKAVERISERYFLLQELFKPRISVFPDLTFRKMKRRWGSCSPRRILINTELIKTPLFCVDFIVMHELCHLLYPKHNKAFYRRLTQLMPDWKIRKERLERSNIS